MGGFAGIMVNFDLFRINIDIVQLET